MLSPAKLSANRANAKHSTGPRTPQGKSRSARNATSHGYFCAHIVLPGEDADAFAVIRENFIDDLRPQTLSELFIVDRIATATWKLNRLQESECELHRSKTDELIELAKVMVEIPHKEMNRFSYRAQGVCREVLEQSGAGMTPAQSTSATLVDRRGDRSLDRLSQLEQRLQNTIFRCHRELRLLRKDRARIEDLPPSPYSRREMESLPERYEQWRENLPADAHFKPPAFDEMEQRVSRNVPQGPNDTENVRNEPIESLDDAIDARGDADSNLRETAGREKPLAVPQPLNPQRARMFNNVQECSAHSSNAQNEPTDDPPIRDPQGRAVPSSAAHSKETET